jgi:hypothetical protein
VLIATALALFLCGGPALLALYGWQRTPLPAARTGRHCSAHRLLSSALLYTLAFNLTFLLQELWLVVPKALTPGLHVTLFHNNHTWTGDNPLAALWQGSGVVATVVSGACCLLWLRRRPTRGSAGVRLWLTWMAYCGFFMALPQLVLGTVSVRSDLGMALTYLQLGPAARWSVALGALLLMPPLAWLMCGEFLRVLAPSAVADARARTAGVFCQAVLPALLALPLIVLFRVPRAVIEVVVVPLVVTAVGLAWVLASAWRAPPRPAADAALPALRWPLLAVAALLLIFQLVLRHGVSVS